MNLQLYLLFRITLVAVVCLLMIALYSLHKNHRQTVQFNQQLIESLAKQLESQLLLIDAGIGQSKSFPDFEPWKQSGGQPGVCIAYKALDSSMPRSLCNGSKFAIVSWPELFAKGYRQLFNPGYEMFRPVMLHGRVHGNLTLTPTVELEITQAWHKMLDLMALSAITILSVCALVYLNIRRALQPANTVVAGIKTIESGDLQFRLPNFELQEWQCIATAINRLTASQQQLLEERQQLVVKLMQAQEDERRLITRELHDELGQCLVAIKVMAASIKQTASMKCPELIDEAEQIGHITKQLLDDIHNLLRRLRPLELDELGLSASLTSLITNWNFQCKDKTRYLLNISGDCAILSDFQALTVFRITQECLTNTAKHASASMVNVNLVINSQSAVLIIKDNGVTKQLPFTNVTGNGLIGIRERSTQLNGNLQLSLAGTHGLIVEVQFPTTAILDNLQ